MQKPDKIFLHNTNLLYALTSSPNIGTIRECFAINQLAVNHVVEYSDNGDLKINGKLIFEIGGADKSFSQIANIPQSYILADSIEYPIGKKIPLWLIGFVY